jgi:ATP-dependent Zn protease
MAKAVLEYETLDADQIDAIVNGRELPTKNKQTNESVNVTV